MQYIKLRVTISPLPHSSHHYPKLRVTLSGLGPVHKFDHGNAVMNRNKCIRSRDCLNTHAIVQYTVYCAFQHGGY